MSDGIALGTGATAPNFRWEYDLRLLPGTSRGLLCRLGSESPWKQIAVFESYNDAARVLDALRRSGAPPNPGLG